VRLPLDGFDTGDFKETAEEIQIWLKSVTNLQGLSTFDFSRQNKIALKALSSTEMILLASPSVRLSFLFCQPVRMYQRGSYLTDLSKI
jgi:hypothetical protein